MARAEQASGILLENFDRSIAPSQDFYEHVNRGWLQRTEIPADKSRYGAFTILDEVVKDKVKEIIEEAGQNAAAQTGAAQQVGDLYKSYINTERRDLAGWQPIERWLRRVDGLASKEAWVEFQSELYTLGVPGLLGVYIDQDAKRSDQYAVHLSQAGITLPDRDYYLLDEPRYQEARRALLAYITDVFTRHGQADAAIAAEKILQLETEIAKIQWTQVELRDPLKSYNKVVVSQFVQEYPHLNWRVHARTSGLPLEGDLIVGQPSFFSGLDRLVADTELKTLQAITRFRIIDTFAGVLDAETEKRSFAFHETALSGVSEQQPLWKRGVDTCSQLLGMPVGQLYVARHFSPEAKQRMQAMVENLKQAFAIRLQALEWMSPGTKQRAMEKLKLFSHKIGYPDRWKDYSSVVIQADSIVDNLIAIHRFEHQYAIQKLGKPIDRGEWLMPPQMVNAYFNPQMNEIVFPAAILQPPFFNLEADDAVNYGGIGAVIGHEISHGFDDQGSKYDGHGNLQNWWTAEDRQEFERRSQQLVKQYAGYRPFADMQVNGELTLGENIGDLGGLNAAYTAYHLALQGKEAPVLDGFTGDQRFFIGWAQVWLFKYREAELRKRLLTDPHSPAKYRTNGIVSNIDAFYQAFAIPTGSPMWLDNQARVRIW